MKKSRRWSTLEQLESRHMLVAPTAVNDAFTVAEDNTLAVVPFSFSANFNTGPLLNTGASWQFLDEIRLADGDTYPVDGSGRTWTDPAFATASSTPASGAWKNGTTPLQAGGINAFPNAPATLAGITGNNQPNTVTTYLFRTTVNATAAQAAETAAVARLLCDDGCVGYINGVEAFRLNMAGGAVNTNTFASSSNGTEDGYSDVPVNLANVNWHAGTNTIALEVHQADASSSDIGMDMQLSLGAGIDGFSYSDNVFNTNRGDVASGTYESVGGNNGTGGIRVNLANSFFGGNGASSGGWTRNFSLQGAGTATVSVRYRLQVGSGFESNEYGEAILTIDGTKYGAGTNTSLAHLGGPGAQDTSWQQYTFNVPLAGGSHTMVLGAYYNNSNGQNENATAYFDDVSITLGGGVTGVLQNDTDPEGDPLTAFLSGSAPTHGTLQFNSDGSFIYTPNLEYSGPDSFSYRARDGALSSNLATVSITVTPVDDLPSVTAKAYAIGEDATLNVDAPDGLLSDATDVDTAHALLTAVVTQQPAHGSVTVHADGSFQYVPELDYAGIDNFRFAAADASGQSTDATVTITISPTNDPPKLLPDSYSVVENTVLNATSLNANGTQIIVPRGSKWIYVDTGVNLGAPGTASSNWTALGYDDENAPWVQLNAANNHGAEYGYGDDTEGRPEVTVVGYGPDANNKYPTTYFRSFFTVADASKVTALKVRLLRDDGAAVYLNGVEIVRDNLAPGALFNTFATNFGTTQEETTFFEFNVPSTALRNGPNVLAVEVHQSSGSSSDVSFDLELEGTVIAGDTGVLLNDHDPEGQPFTAALASQPSHGTVTFNPDGTFVYTPNVNYEGPDSFTYTASDGTLTSNPATVSITVTPGPNDRPIVAADAYSVGEDGVLSVTTAATGLLQNDSDGDLDPLTASVQTQPAHGSVTINPNGTFTYTPAANFFGADTFTYRAFDGSEFSAPGTVTITVTGTEDPPTATNDLYFVQPNTALVVSAADGLLANDFDVDVQPITATSITLPAHGTLTSAANGSFTYTPAANYRGTDSFTYRASDGDDLSTVATVTLTVDARPVATGASYQTNEDTTLNIAANGVLAGDTDAENDPLTSVVVSQPAHGALTLQTNGAFTYVPAANYSGPDSFTYAANDGDQLSLPATINITVNPVNDAPVAAGDAYDVVQNNVLTVDVAAGLLANDSDVDNATLTAVPAPGGAPHHGILTLAADGSFTYEPDIDYTGPDSFTYVASDGSLQSTVTTVTINVSSASQLLAISEIMYHPSSENDAQEYIEIHNLGIGTLNLTGWKFDKGIDFTFPSMTLGGGQYLVIAASTAAFAAKYPTVTNFIGNWNGSLSNTGEEIELVDAHGDRIDRVEYADEGDWALRRSETTGGVTGWTWIAAHDGTGPSLELINDKLSNQRGQNWSSSTVAQGTPGAANSVANANTAPVIWDVTHSPAVPKSGQTVTVLAKLADVPDNTVTGVVKYRVSTTTPGAFQDAALFDDGLHGDGAAGDGTYGATLPAQANLTVVEFYVSASNNHGLTRTWPGPTDTNGTQGANLLYQVDDSVYTGDQPVYRLILSAAENQTFRNSSRFSDAQFNTTFINTDGTGTDVIYNAGVRIRGSGSRTRAVPNWRVNIPSDRRWQGVTAINLNTQYTHPQLVGMELFELAGLPFEEPTAVQVRMNGENRATEVNVQHGSYVRVEAVGAEWADNHYPLDPQGNFYRGNGGRLEYLGANPSLYANQYSKSTNSSANDYTDIVALTKALDPTQTPAAVFVDTVKQIIDIDEWMRFFAINTLLVNEENGLINGNDDDYSLYRGIVDPRFDLVVHDMDTVLGQGDTNGSTTRNILNDLRQNPRLARLFDQPEFLNLYYYHLQNLANTVFSPAVIDPLIDNALASWIPAATLTAMKTFVAQRVSYVLAQIPSVNTPPVAWIAGEPPVVTPLNSASITVSGPGVTAYRYRLDGGALSAETPIATPISLSSLANGTHTLAVIGRNAAGTYQSETAATIASWTVNTAFSPLRISEVLADNKVAVEHQGTYPDMIELFNAGATTLDLSKYALSDDPLTPNKFKFAAGATLAAGAYLVVYADSDATIGIHTGFSLNDKGEGLYLYDTTGAGALVDQVEFGLQLADRSIARDSQFQWRLSTPTFGSANNAAIALGDPSHLKINEWLADGQRLFNADLIELYNPDAQPVALGGMYFTDNLGGYPNRSPIHALSFIAGGGYTVFTADGETDKGAEHVDFQISPDRETISLLNSHLQTVDAVIIQPQKSDISQGRQTDGAALYSYFAPPTFGASNSTSTPQPNLYNLLDYLRISEIMFNPSSDGDLEFIELHNTGTTTLHLEGVQIQNGIDFTFPAMDLAANAYTVVVFDPVKFAARYGGSLINVAGQFTGRLSNSTDHVELALPSPYDANILDIEYLDTWQPTADGGGRSLVLKSDTTALSALDDGANWRASWASGGSPGRADLLYADQNGDGKVTIADLIQLRNKLGSANMTGDLTFDGVVDAKDVASLVSSYGIVALPGSSPEAPAAVVATRRTSTVLPPAASAVATAHATGLAVRPSATPSNDTASKLTARGSIARRPISASAIDSAIGSDDVLSATRTARVARTRSN